MNGQFALTCFVIQDDQDTSIISVGTLITMREKMLALHGNDGNTELFPELPAW